MDKAKRKLEADLKASQAGLEEIDRSRKEMQEVLKKKDQELKMFAAKAEDDQNQSANLSKKLKELQVCSKHLFSLNSKI